MFNRSLAPPGGRCEGRSEGKEEEEGTENETDGDDEDESSDDEAEEEGDESDDDDDDDEEESDDDDEDEEDEASSASEEEESDQDDATANESVERATAVEEQAGNNDAVEEEEADGQEDHDEDQPIGDPAPTSATKQREVEAIESEPHEQCDAVAALLACSEADEAGGKPAPRAKVHAAAEGGSGKKIVKNAAVTKESKAMPMAQTFPMPCRERSGARRPITPRCEAAPWSVEHKDE